MEKGGILRRGVFWAAGIFLLLGLRTTAQAQEEKGAGSWMEGAGVAALLDPWIQPEGESVSEPEETAESENGFGSENGEESESETGSESGADEEDEAGGLVMADVTDVLNVRE